MSGRLFVVATPIGNLGDVTLRSLEVLRAVPLVAAEDTRLTRRLFARHGIETPLVSYHARSAPTRTASLLGHLRGGADLALVTDAGTPSVSDPGEGLVAAWAAEGGAVVPIPGASAVLAAVAASGLAGPRWGFEGFLPRSGRERRARLARIGADDRATVLFEAPGRLAGTLADLAAACGADRPAAVCRELTKLHESIVRGALASLAAQADSGAIPSRGEMTVIVAAAEKGTVGTGRAARGPGDTPTEGGVDTLMASSGADDAATRLEAGVARVEALVAGGLGRAEAARRVARETGLSRRALYGHPSRSDAG